MIFIFLLIYLTHLVSFIQQPLKESMRFIQALVVAAGLIFHGCEDKAVASSTSGHATVPSNAGNPPSKSVGDHLPSRPGVSSGSAERHVPSPQGSGLRSGTKGKGGPVQTEVIDAPILSLTGAAGAVNIPAETVAPVARAASGTAEAQAAIQRFWEETTLPVIREYVLSAEATPSTLSDAQQALRAEIDSRRAATGDAQLGAALLDRSDALARSANDLARVRAEITSLGQTQAEWAAEPLTASMHRNLLEAAQPRLPVPAELAQVAQELETRRQALLNP